MSKLSSQNRRSISQSLCRRETCSLPTPTTTTAQSGNGADAEERRRRDVAGDLERDDVAELHSPQKVPSFAGEDERGDGFLDGGRALPSPVTSSPAYLAPPQSAVKPIRTTAPPANHPSLSRRPPTAPPATICTLVYSAVPTSGGGLVLDTDGHPVVTGFPYYVRAAQARNDGNLGWVSLNGSCPLNVLLKPFPYGPPVMFFPEESRQNKSVLLAEKLSVMFAAPPP